MLDPASPVVVLVEGAEPAPQPLVPAVEAKKAPAPALRGRTAVAAVAGTVLMPVLATAVVVVALIVTLVLLL